MTAVAVRAAAVMAVAVITRRWRRWLGLVWMGRLWSSEWRGVWLRVCTSEWSGVMAAAE